MGFPDERPDEDEDPFVAGVDALADDLTNTGGLDDEEAVTWSGEPSTYDTGIVFYPKSPAGYGIDTGRYRFDVEVFNETFDNGFLDVWIDFDGNRQFDYYELEESRVVLRLKAAALSGLEIEVPEDPLVAVLTPVSASQTNHSMPRLNMVAGVKSKTTRRSIVVPI